MTLVYFQAGLVIGVAASSYRIYDIPHNVLHNAICIRSFHRPWPKGNPSPMLSRDEYSVQGKIGDKVCVVDSASGEEPTDHNLWILAHSDTKPAW